MKNTAHLILVGLLVLLTGCRGMQSEEPPIHISPNMDRQEKFIGQQMNPLFENKMAMRAPVPGTIARGFLREDGAFYRGRTDEAGYVTAVPVDVTRDLLERGRERYNIYCTVCHGEAGDGQGIIMVGNGGAGYGYIPAPDFHADRFRVLPEGYYFEVITNGTATGTMPGYGTQIPVADRWAIVAYVRALQRSQNASGEDLPESEILRIEQERGIEIN